MKLMMLTKLPGLAAAADIYASWVLLGAFTWDKPACYLFLTFFWTYFNESLTYRKTLTSKHIVNEVTQCYGV